MRIEPTRRARAGAALALAAALLAGAAHARQQPAPTAQPIGPAPREEAQPEPQPAMPYPAEASELARLRSLPPAPVAVAPAPALPAGPALAPVVSSGPLPGQEPARSETYMGFASRYGQLMAEERARALAAGTAPSALPWLGQAGRFWTGYAAAAGRAADAGLSVSVGRHVEAWGQGLALVGGAAARGLYEAVVGRSFEFLFGRDTPEDRVEAAEARRYADVASEGPGAQFDYAGALGRLWGAQGESSPRGMPRRWERKVWLSARWSVGWLVGLAGTGAAQPGSTLALTRAPDGARQWRALPSHARFGPAATELALQGHTFESVAGRTGSVMVSIRLLKEQPLPALGQQEIFAQPLAPGARRVAYEVPMAGLSEFLLYARAHSSQMQIEQVYDY